MHVSPTGIFKLVYYVDENKVVKSYIGEGKWNKSNIDILNKLVNSGSAKEVEFEVAKEFIQDFDNKYNLQKSLFRYIINHDGKGEMLTAALDGDYGTLKKKYATMVSDGIINVCFGVEDAGDIIEFISSVSDSENIAEGAKKVCEEISRDINRTFYTEKFVSGDGQIMLKNIKKRAARFAPMIGEGRMFRI